MPAKPDLGAIDLGEALHWGEAHATDEHRQTRRGTAPDYAQLAVEYPSGIVASITLSHASYLRKGFAPELELHGTLGSLSVDRLRGELHFSNSPDPAQLLETTNIGGDVNRFQEYVLPAFRDQLAGTDVDHPGLDDGLCVQRFTEAAVVSAARGTWVELAELERG